jgi:hypothetical protein
MESRRVECDDRDKIEYRTKKRFQLENHRVNGGGRGHSEYVDVNLL